MRRAIVHIGMPRTGTTTLQRVLTSMRPKLGEVGVLYPDLTPRSAPEPHLSHQHLGEALDGRRPPSDRLELLTRLADLLAATDAETIFLSYESLCLIPPSLGIPRMLAELFARHGFAMEVLVTIKPQGEFINSTYTWRTQFLRESRTFSKYFQVESRKRALDYTRLFAPWRAACSGNMKVTPLRDVRSDQPLLTRIMAEVGLETVVSPLFSPADLTLVENRSPGPVAVEVARQLRMAGAHLGLNRPRRDITRFVEDNAHRKGLDRVAFKGVDAALHAKDAARWGLLNDDFARRVWGSTWTSRVANETAIPVNEIARAAGDPHLGAQIASIMDETCEVFEIHLGSKARVAVSNMADDLSASFYRRFRHMWARKGPGRVR